MTTPLLKYRLRKKWSQRAFAEYIALEVYMMAPPEVVREMPNLTHSLVAKWEKGRVQPSLEYALAIQRLCGRSVPLSSLLVRR